MSKKIIVIGGTAAGLSAASKAKRVDSNLEITIFERSGYISYGACGLPYFIKGLIEEPDDLVSLTVKQVTQERGIPIFIHHEVVGIDREKKEILVKDLENEQLLTHPYDELVIATGAVPMKLGIPGEDADGVYYLRTVEDGIRVKEAVKATEHKRAAIIGGGFIGLEVAEALTENGIEVSLYEAMPRLLPFLENDFSAEILKVLEVQGVKVHLGTSVTELLTEDGKICGVKDQNGVTSFVDFAILCVGVVPNTLLAKNAGLKLGIKGGIVVNEEMKTSDPCIWACGDCVQMRDLITGAATYVPLGTTANKQGRITGDNIAGNHDKFKGVLGSMVTKVFDLYIAATGLNLERAKNAGFDAVTTTITKGERASYYPGGQDDHICLIMDKKTGRLLGAQGIGGEAIAGRMNVFVTAIICKMTVDQINELDLVYAPPVAPVYDPILIAANQAMKKVER